MDMSDLNTWLEISEQMGEDLGLLKTSQSKGKEKRMRWKRAKSRSEEKEKNTY